MQLALGADAALELGQQVFLVTTIVGRKHQLLGRRLEVVGDVEEVAVTPFVKQDQLALGGENIFSQHDHAVGVSTSRGAIGELGDVFGLQAEGLELPFADDQVLDVGGLATRLGVNLVAWRAGQRFPGIFREILGHGDEVGHGVVAEDEVDTAIVVPAIEVLGLGEIGVAAQEGAAKTGAETEFEGLVELGGGAFVRRAIAGTIEQGQDLAGVGQGQDERMITPGAVIGDVRAFFAFAGGFDERAVGIENSSVEEGRRLLGPHLETAVVDGIEQVADVVGGSEATAEIAGGGGVGGAGCAQGVEEDFIVAAQFKILQTGAVAQGVVGEIKDVIGFMIGQMDFEQVQSAIDGLGESDMLHNFVDGPESAVTESVTAFGKVIVDVAGGELRLFLLGKFAWIEAALQTALAAVPDLA